MTRQEVSTAHRTPRRGTAVAAPAEPAGPAPSAPIVRWGTVTVPVPVGVHLPAPRLRMPHVSVSYPASAVRQTVRAAEKVGASLPPPQRLAYYGGLGAMAALGALEWPVAAAIGAGMWIAGKGGQRGRMAPGGPAAEPAEPADGSPAEPAVRTAPRPKKVAAARRRA